MRQDALYLRSLEGLRNFVNETFCNYYQLKRGAFQLTERILRQGGEPCGIHFFLHGPRAVRFTAIWDIKRNQILFYEATGERFMKAQLNEGPRFDMPARQRAA